MDAKPIIEEQIAQLTQELIAEPTEARYMERGRLYYKKGEFGLARNDFNTVIEKDGPQREVAEAFIRMLEEILAFRCTDFYNP